MLLLLFVNLIGCKKEKEEVVVVVVPEVKLPELTTTFAVVTSMTNALCGGNISTDGGAEVTSKGICWSVHPFPTINDSTLTIGGGIGSYQILIEELNPNTIYYVRAFAENSKGVNYGNDVLIKTYTGTVTDIDGNIYYTVTIGSQEWMAENLRTTRYRNGNPIQNVSDNFQWFNLLTGAYCYFENNPIFDTIYGKLYNWYSIADSRRIAPVGWHVPSTDEWNVLLSNLGGSSVAGGKLKELYFSLWTSPNSNATNETSFNARPGGGRYNNDFLNNKKNGFWWSSEAHDVYYNCAYYYTVYFNSPSVDNTFYYKSSGFSVRCVKD